MSNVTATVPSARTVNRPTVEQAVLNAEQRNIRARLAKLPAKTDPHRLDAICTLADELGADVVARILSLVSVRSELNAAVASQTISPTEHRLLKPDAEVCERVAPPTGGGNRRGATAHLKCTEGGAIHCSDIGNGRMGQTFFVEDIEWLYRPDIQDQMRTFIRENDGVVSEWTKSDGAGGKRTYRACLHRKGG